MQFIILDKNRKFISYRINYWYTLHVAHFIYHFSNHDLIGFGCRDPYV